VLASFDRQYEALIAEHSDAKTEIDLVLTSLVKISQLAQKSHRLGRATAQAVSRWLPTPAAGFKPGSGQVGFVVDKVALGQVFSEYFGFPCQYSFHQILHHHNHPGQVQ
jgi:hypothetical protein